MLGFLQENSYMIHLSHLKHLFNHRKLGSPVAISDKARDLSGLSQEKILSNGPVVVGSSANSKRRDIDYPAQIQQKLYGKLRKPEDQGLDCPQLRLSAALRENELPKVSEDSPHDVKAEWVKLRRKSLELKTKVKQTHRLPQERSSVAEALRAKEQNIFSSAAVALRTSVFSASRRVVQRMTVFAAPGEDPRKIDGKMTADDDNQLKEYTMEKVREHKTDDSAWVVIHGRVYDVTK